MCVVLWVCFSIFESANIDVMDKYNGQIYTINRTINSYTTLKVLGLFK